MQCPECKEVRTGVEHVEAIKDWGYCLNCDAAKGAASKEIESED